MNVNEEIIHDWWNADPVSYTHLNGINKALRSAQGQPEYAFNDQHSRDGKVRIALRSAS